MVYKIQKALKICIGINVVRFVLFKQTAGLQVERETKYCRRKGTPFIVTDFFSYTPIYQLKM